MASNTTNSVVGQSVVQADFHAFTANSLTITKTFQDILVELTQFDSTKWISGVQFAPKWQPIMQDLANVLAASRTTASNTAAYCTQFTTVTVPFASDITAATLPIEVLAQHTAMADSLAASAQATSDAFTALRNSVGAFISMFQNATVAPLAAAQNAINQEFAQAENKKASMNQRMMAIDMMQVDQSSLAMMNAAFQGALAPISAANSSLQTMGFSTIWNAMKSDCTSVSSYLKAANGYHNISPIFWTTMNNVHGVYEGIAQGANLLH
ncbi:hypothetical protein B0H19DRAFT_1193841 [Mycena capillaripes]|nr:hypothetical protein B0H19DRAFT_1193841 [Mycena capillaripes]